MRITVKDLRRALEVMREDQEVRVDPRTLSKEALEAIGAVVPVWLRYRKTVKESHERTLVELVWRPEEDRLVAPWDLEPTEVMESEVEGGVDRLFLVSLPVGTSVVRKVIVQGPGVYDLSITHMVVSPPAPGKKWGRLSRADSRIRFDPLISNYVIEWGEERIPVFTRRKE